MDSRSFGLKLIDYVLGHEGSYANNPADRGGETMWGITHATARAQHYTAPMRDMTRDQAISIYYDVFWVRVFERVYAQGMPKLAYVCLDYGVNSGSGNAVKTLQKALNALNLQGKRWSDVAEDGALGLLTTSALAACKSKMNDAEDLLAFMVTAQRVNLVMNLAARDERQETFMLGWMRRYLTVSECDF